MTSIKDSALPYEDIVDIALARSKVAEAHGTPYSFDMIAGQEIAAAQRAKSDAAWLAQMQGMADAAQELLNDMSPITQERHAEKAQLLHAKLGDFEKLKDDLAT